MSLPTWCQEDAVWCECGTPNLRSYHRCSWCGRFNPNSDTAKMMARAGEPDPTTPLPPPPSERTDWTERDREII